MEVEVLGVAERAADADIGLGALLGGASLVPTFLRYAEQSVPVASLTHLMHELNESRLVTEFEMKELKHAEGLLVTELEADKAQHAEPQEDGVRNGGDATHEYDDESGRRPSAKDRDAKCKSSSAGTAIDICYRSRSGQHPIIVLVVSA